MENASKPLIFYFSNSLTFIFHEDKAILKEERMLELVLFSMIPVFGFVFCSILLISNFTTEHLTPWFASTGFILFIGLFFRNKTITLNLTSNKITRQYNWFEYVFFEEQVISTELTKIQLKVIIDPNADSDFCIRLLACIPEEKKLIGFKGLDEVKCLQKHFKQLYGISISELYV